MRHFPIFLDLRGSPRRACPAPARSRSRSCACCCKTEARIDVFGTERGRGRRGLGGRRPARARRAGADRRATPTARRCSTARTATRSRTRGRPRSAGRPARSSISSTISTDSAFITPAIVDRDPVTVAIGTEGAAPVLARKIKAEVEAMLPVRLGVLARIGQAFRGRVEALDSAARRAFWTRFYFQTGPRALDAGEDAARRGAGAAAGRGRGGARRLRAFRRHGAGRSGASDAEGASAAARGGRGDP